MFEKLIKNFADKLDIEKLSVIENLFSYFSSKEFILKDLSRNKDLRIAILRRLASSVMTDDERAEFFGLPKGCRIREGAKIISPENLIIGEFCWIGEGAILDASGGLEIGSHTSIGLNVMLWTHDSHKLNIRGQNIQENQSQIKRKKTKIGSNCFIAGPSVVMPGVTIGDKCIVSPGSIVYQDLKDGTIFQPYKQMFDGLIRLDELEKEITSIKKLLVK